VRLSEYLVEYSREITKKRLLRSLSIGLLKNALGLEQHRASFDQLTAISSAPCDCRWNPHGTA